MGGDPHRTGIPGPQMRGTGAPGNAAREIHSILGENTVVFCGIRRLYDTLMAARFSWHGIRILVSCKTQREKQE